MRSKEEFETQFKKALLVGTIRNGSKHLESDILLLLDSLTAILPTEVFIVESDSVDNTLQILNRMSMDDSRIRYKSLGNLRTQHPNRIDRLRFCRNEYINELRNFPGYKEVDLVVVADLDGINTRINSKSLYISMNSYFDWDVLTANQSGPYYDLLALRHKLWCPSDFQEEILWFNQFVNHQVSHRHSVRDRMIRIPKDYPPIEVDSAFGGLGLYKKWIFDAVDYTDDGLLAINEIDHVTLHRKAKLLGAKIFIDPNLINAHRTHHVKDNSSYILLTKKILRVVPFSHLKWIFRKAYKIF